MVQLVVFNTLFSSKRAPEMSVQFSTWVRVDNITP